MKVKELIAKLQKIDPEQIVIISECDDYYTEVDGFKKAKVRLDLNSGWYFEDSYSKCSAIIIT